MNIILDSTTQDSLKKDLEKQNKNAVRLMIKGFG